MISIMTPKAKAQKELNNINMTRRNSIWNSVLECRLRLFWLLYIFIVKISQPQWISDSNENALISRNTYSLFKHCCAAEWSCRRPHIQYLILKMNKNIFFWVKLKHQVGYVEGIWSWTANDNHFRCLAVVFWCCRHHIRISERSGAE